MTLVELARSNVWFYARRDWGPGQFVHADFYYLSADGSAGGVRTCWCHAPVTAAVPWKEDDLWAAYTGPETADVVELPPLPLEMALAGLPTEVLLKLADLHEQATAAQAALGDVPPWAVGPPMRA